MQTRYWLIKDIEYPDSEMIAEAALLLQQGKVVAFPTETVYGLGADARSDAAVDRIFQVKGRPADNPLIVHIAEKSQLRDLTLDVPLQAEQLIDRFWPGPLTLVLPVKKGAVSSKVTAGLPTVAVRMPDHPIALKLIHAAGPLAAPSANRSGRPSPTTAQHVLQDLAGKVDGLLDGGPCGIGLESTVVECTAEGLVVLRPGGISIEQLREADPSVRLDQALHAPANGELSESTPRSPGMKYTHYAPQGEMIVITGHSVSRVRERMEYELRAASARGKKTGVLTFNEHQAGYEADVVLNYGSIRTPALAARTLYAALREFDEREVDFIVAEGWAEEGIGLAVMNRLRKAAGGKVVTV